MPLSNLVWISIENERVFIKRRPGLRGRTGEAREIEGKEERAESTKGHGKGWAPVPTNFPRFLRRNLFHKDSCQNFLIAE